MFEYLKPTIAYTLFQTNVSDEIWENIEWSLRSHINYQILHNVRFFGYFDLSKYQITIDYTKNNERKAESFNDNKYEIMELIRPYIKEMERQYKLEIMLD